jgi:hypothetical protein
MLPLVCDVEMPRFSPSESRGFVTQPTGDTSSSFAGLRLAGVRVSPLLTRYGDTFALRACRNSCCGLSARSSIFDEIFQRRRVFITAIQPEHHATSDVPVERLESQSHFSLVNSFLLLS